MYVNFMFIIQFYSILTFGCNYFVCFSFIVTSSFSFKPAFITIFIFYYRFSFKIIYYGLYLIFSAKMNRFIRIKTVILSNQGI